MGRVLRVELRLWCLCFRKVKYTAGLWRFLAILTLHTNPLKNRKRNEGGSVSLI